MRYRFPTTAKGFLTAVLIGALVIGTPLGVEGVRYGIMTRGIKSNKDLPGQDTVLYWATNHFVGGALLGGLAGALGWSVLTCLTHVRSILSARPVKTLEHTPSTR